MPRSQDLVILMLMTIKRSVYDSKHNVASFSMISMDSLCLGVALMPRSQDLVIFMLMTTTDKLIALPLAAHARAG